MRRTIVILLLITVLCGLSGCAKKPKAEVSIDYGNSTLYTKEDMDAAIAVIRNEFDSWEGCELHSIAYGSDDACSADNIAWMNELEAANDAQETFSQCILRGVECRSGVHRLAMVACAFRRRSLEADDLGIWLTPQAKSRIEPASIEGYMTMGDAIRKKLNSIREPKSYEKLMHKNLFPKSAAGLKNPNKLSPIKQMIAPTIAIIYSFFSFILPSPRLISIQKFCTKVFIPPASKSFFPRAAAFSENSRESIILSATSPK